MRRLFAVFVTLALLTGCTTTPDGNRQLSATGQIALETATRIAVRRAVLDSPRALEKAHNIRVIVARLQSIVTAESTLAALEAEVHGQIDKLGLSPIDNADAHDLLALFGAALEEQLGTVQLNEEGSLKVAAFLNLILAVLPA